MSAGPRVVISQSMLFPWVGMLEQIRLADVFVHYDDVQYSKGSFVNRVQVKLPEGIRWMTVPLQDFHFGQRVDELQPNGAKDWRRQHLDLLARSFKSAPFRDDAIGLAKAVYVQQYASVGDLSRASMLALADYFGFASGRHFLDVRDLDVPGISTDRVLAVVQRLGGGTYITGHGAARYLEHERFAAASIDVEYMDYRLLPYSQAHGPFTPYVSSLDLIANCGHAGLDVIVSKTLPWRQFINERG